MLSGSDLDVFLSTLTAAYGIDHFNTDSIEFTRAQLVLDMAIEQEYSADEFNKRMRAFIRANRFPTWTPGDFFAGARPKVYPYSWYQERVHENRNNADAIGCYRVAHLDAPMWGWIHEVGDALPLFEATPDVPALPQHIEPVSTETVEYMKLVKENLVLLNKLADAEATIDRDIRLRHHLQNENDELRSKVKEMQEWIEARADDEANPDAFTVQADDAA